MLPTGCGKTICFASVIEHEIQDGSRALVLAHRGELLTQAADKLRDACGIESALEKAGSSSLGSCLPVTVGSVQSLGRIERLDRFPEDYFRTIVVDEAHHALSDTYQRVLWHFPEANVLGVTATPDRGDKKKLSEYFDSEAYDYPMSRAVQEGYLVPVKAQMIPLELNIREARLSNGDYAAGDIGSILEPYLEQIAREMVHYCQGRKTVVFLPLISTSRMFCRILNKAGLRACEVNGGSRDRAEILADFAAGEYDVLCNSMLLTEGWDCPAVDCVVVLRPTKIRSLYQQMVGRGMRLSPETGKDHLLLLDFLWLTEQHDLCRPSSLISRDGNIAKEMDAILSADDEIHDLLEAEEQAERNVLEERERSLAGRLAAMRGREKKLVDPLQYALSIAAEDLVNYMPIFAWEKLPPTQKQLELLEKRGISAGAVTSRGLASRIIDRLHNRLNAGLATPKQIRCLEKFGYRQVGTWSFEAASREITRLSNHGWQLPMGFNPKEYKPGGVLLG